MATSSVQRSRRPQVLPPRTLAAALLTAGALIACNGGAGDKPPPQKVERLNPFDRVQPTKRSAPDDPLRNPAIEAPRGRDGAQVSEAEILETLAEAAAAREVSNLTQERSILRKCANKTPVDVRCDGAMGLSLIEAKKRRAAALYYLSSAASVDDPKADAQLYLRVGEALRSAGKLDEAIAALRLALAREPSAEITFALGRALSLSPDTLIEAADAMAQARALDDRIGWLHDEAVIRGQIPVREQAARALELFTLYRERATDVPADELPTRPDSLAPRMRELELLAKQYPTQAEWEKARAADEAAPATEPEPIA